MDKAKELGNVALVSYEEMLETYEKLKDRVIYFNDIEECKKHLNDRLKVTNR